MRPVIARVMNFMVGGEMTGDGDCETIGGVDCGMC